MSAGRVVPTRSNLLRARVQLERIRKGADAVSRKRQALVNQLFQIARPAIDTRAEIGRRVAAAAAAMLDAVAARGIDTVRSMGRPAGELLVEAEAKQIWGVPVADVAAVEKTHRTLEARGTPPGSTEPSIVAATDAFESLVDLLIASAAGEVRVARLADAVATTSQQLRLLRERVEPALVGRIAEVARTLEEREREEHVRLKHLQRRTRGEDSRDH
jgi:V/A-type H+-transporting ATPase subunit D